MSDNSDDNLKQIIAAWRLLLSVLRVNTRFISVSRLGIATSLRVFNRAPEGAPSILTE